MNTGKALCGKLLTTWQKPRWKQTCTTARLEVTRPRLSHTCGTRKCTCANFWMTAISHPTTPSANAGLLSLPRSGTRSKCLAPRRGAKIAAGLESIEQTAREHTDNTRIYYKYLLEKMCPFIREKKRKYPDVDFSTMKEMQSFLAWSEGFKTYREEILKEERTGLAM